MELPDLRVGDSNTIAVSLKTRKSVPIAVTRCANAPKLHASLALAVRARELQFRVSVVTLHAKGRERKKDWRPTVFEVDLFDPATQPIWLNITNLALGAATIIAFAVVGWGVVTEVLARLRNPFRAALEADDHAFAYPELGLTMADGGKKLDDEESEE
ncbi:MAG TPA: hypothetical protein VEZ11_08375 [Thermoanaerobaculia bacterium]|nr:hypothetical protein [Thermoanaerobaculia bacterium]